MKEPVKVALPTNLDVAKGLFYCALIAVPVAAILGLMGGVFIAVIKFFWGLI